MTAALSIALPGSEPLPPDYRIKWTISAAGEWVRNVVLRNGNAEFFVSRLPEIDLTTNAREQK